MTRSPVVFILIDGLRPDAITEANCPNLTALIARGASSMQASSITPCITLPCHMSIFHSVPPARHGVTTNVWSPMARPLPGLIEVAHTAGLKCAFVYNWEPLRNINEPGALFFSYFKENVLTPDGDTLNAAVAAQMLTQDRPDFTFMYFGTVDEVGHAHGWLSPEYLEQLATVDKALQVVLEAIPADGQVLLQADHGGHDRTHGTLMVEDMTIPWVVAGPGVRAGYTIPNAVSLLDTAPTLARLLGITPHPQWEGRCVEEIFG
jgi:predicted AlkP superfamily pyrophosphatase or phosphodiesterase